MGKWGSMELGGCAANHPLGNFDFDRGLELGLYLMDCKWQNGKFQLVKLAQVSGSEGNNVERADGDDDDVCY